MVGSNQAQVALSVCPPMNVKIHPQHGPDLSHVLTALDGNCNVSLISIYPACAAADD